MTPYLRSSDERRQALAQAFALLDPRLATGAIVRRLEDAVPDASTADIAAAITINTTPLSAARRATMRNRTAGACAADLAEFEAEAAQQEPNGRALAVVRLAGRAIGYLVLVVALYLGGFVLGQAWAGAW